MGAEFSSDDSRGSPIVPASRSINLKSIVFDTGAALALIVLLSLNGGSFATSAVAATPLQPAAGLYFEPAPGTDDPARARFVARGDGHVTWIHPAGALIALPQSNGKEEGAGVGLRLVAANGNAAGVGVTQLRGRSHYYLGSDPGAWREGVPHFARVEFPEVYPGIGVAYHGEQGGLEFDFIVEPGVDPDQVRLAFDEVAALRLGGEGDLLLDTRAGELILHRPVAYQEAGGRRLPVDAAFALDEAGQVVSFRLGAYDRSRALVIDPIISYADHLGGSDDDTGLALAVDGDGNRYVTGSTVSVDFGGVLRSANSGLDTFVAKLAPDGERLYVTYLGGFEDAADTANALAVAGDGSVYLAGDTESGSFPMLGALQPAYAGKGDAFVARLSAAGALIYSTYLGGGDRETARAIALGADGTVHVGGSTLSDDFPGMGNCSLQCARVPQAAGADREGDGYIVKISAGGDSYLYASYLGGGGADSVAALAVDSDGAAYVAGTASDGFPITPAAFQEEFAGGVSDGYVARLSPAGDALDYSTFLGGSAFDQIFALALDGDRNAYVTGITASGTGLDQDLFPTSAGTPFFGGGPFDAFVGKLDPEGELVYSTFLGGSGDDRGLAIAVDSQNQAIVVGETQSGNFPLVAPFQVRRLGERDGFIAVLAADGMTRVFSTYLGGTGNDQVTAVVAEASGAVHIAGTGNSTNLPAVDAVQEDNAGGTDAFVMRIDGAAGQPLPALRVSVDAAPAAVPIRQSLAFEVMVDNRGTGAASGVLVQVDATNVSSISSTVAGCESIAATSLLCPVVDVPAGMFRTLGIRGVPQQIGPAMLTAALVRADQSGISLDPALNTDSLERLVVDNSDESVGGVSWELLALLWVLPFLRRRYSP